MIIGDIINIHPSPFYKSKLIKHLSGLRRISHASSIVCVSVDNIQQVETTGWLSRQTTETHEDIVWVACRLRQDPLLMFHV